MHSFPPAAHTRYKVLMLYVYACGGRSTFGKRDDEGTTRAGSGKGT